MDWYCLDSRGRDGILVMWDRKVVEKIVHMHFRNVGDQFTWAFVGIYGPNTDNDRSLLWDESTSLISWKNLQWYFGLYGLF